MRLQLPSHEVSGMVGVNRRELIYAGAGATLACSSGGVVAPPAVASADRWDATLDAVFAQRAPVALAGAVITRDGVAWSGVRGVRRAGGDEATGPDDRWHLGSNTKAMTAALYGRLVDRGDARWDAPLIEVFSDLEVHPGWSGVTLLDLMHHRAGLTDEGAMGPLWLMTARADPRPMSEQRTAIAAGALGVPPSGDRGRFAYGNANYVLVGAAIERIVQSPWETVIRSDLFEPLGLGSAAIGAPQGESGSPNVWGHSGSGDARRAMDPALAVSDNPLAMAPAGGAYMTISDYARFLRIFLDDGGNWLKPETVARLKDPSGEGGEAYACGWGVRRSATGERRLQHEGSNTLWHAVALVAPERSWAIVGLTNEGPASGAARDLALRLMSLAPGGA